MYQGSVANVFSNSDWIRIGSVVVLSTSAKKSTYEGWCSGEKATPSGW